MTQASTEVLAHGVGRIYQSPIPLALYLVGAAVAVAASFLVVALRHRASTEARPHRIAGPRLAQTLSAILQALGLLGLALTVIAAMFSPDAPLTLAPLLFWVGLVVGGVTISALLGGAWPAADPWSSLEGLYRGAGEANEGGRRPPWWLGPLTVYLLFWFELVSGVGFLPLWVLVAVIAYTLYAFSVRPVFGDHWREADPFGILFGFASRLAPVRLRDEGLVYEPPAAGLTGAGPMPAALFASIFVLLGSTTLDNLRETVAWFSVLQGLGLDTASPKIVDSAALFVFALAFLVPYLAAVRVGAGGADRGLWDRARRLGWSLVPIGIMYVLAHNAPLVMTGVPQIVAQLSDPLARGWDLFGTAEAFATFVPDPAVVWFIEIALIVAGHILGVVAAHSAAVRLSASRRAAVSSQVSLTALMTALTVVTLWLLAQPLVA